MVKLFKREIQCVDVCVYHWQYEAIKSHDNAILIKINWAENFQQQRRPLRTYEQQKENTKN